MRTIYWGMLAVFSAGMLGLLGCEGTSAPSMVAVDKPVAFQGEFNPNNLPLGFAEGELAPPIKGVDLDGESFQLADYRGKVTMLTFWADW